MLRIITLACTAVAASTAATTVWAQPFNLYGLLDEDGVAAELERRHAEGGAFPEKMERITRGFVGAPYVLSPLGEGVGTDPDPDPRFRLDAFDCTTFVETALAMVSCDDLSSARAFLKGIRYQGTKFAFEERRHFMTSQWIPGLEARNLMRDVTQEVGGAATREIQLVLDHDRWKRRRVARSIDLPRENVPTGTLRLAYVPTSIVLDRLARVPPGSIVNIVRAVSRSSFDVVTHQGLIFRRPEDGELIVRHASPVSKRVIDEPLRRMAERYQRPRKWPIVGMNFLLVLDPNGAPPTSLPRGPKDEQQDEEDEEEDDDEGNEENEDQP